MSKMILKNFIIFFFTVSALLSSVSYAEEQKSIFNIGNEKQISASDMDCSYWNEDYYKSLYNFEYPKIAMINNGKPIIAFVDKQSNNLFLTEITDQDVKVLYNQPSHDLNSWNRWPVIFEKKNKIYLALLLEDLQKSITGIKVYLFDRENKRINIAEEKIFKIDKRCVLWGIYPYHDNYELIGRCTHICLRFLPTILMGGDPTYYQNASFLFDGNKESSGGLAKQAIEEPGCYNVKNQVYDVSTNGAIHAAWVRNTTTIGLRHDETIYLRANKDGANWSPAIEVSSVKNTEVINNQISNLALASYGDSSYILWQDREKGLFFSELINGNKIEFTRISDSKDADAILPFATAIKVAADNDGNAYALWIERNFRNTDRVYSYKLHFKVRINRQWKQEMIINRGTGSVQLPDMKVDKEGNVHITYIKSMSDNVGHGKYGCFYMKLARQDKKVEAVK